MTKERLEYLEDLANQYGMDVQLVVDLAELMGPEEDYDGLVSMIQDFS